MRTKNNCLHDYLGLFTSDSHNTDSAARAGSIKCLVTGLRVFRVFNQAYQERIVWELAKSINAQSDRPDSVERRRVAMYSFVLGTFPSAVWYITL